MALPSRTRAREGIVGSMTLEAALAENTALREQIKLQSALIEKLTLELAILKKRLFGRQSEASEHLDLQGSLFDLTTLPVEEPSTPPSESKTPGKPPRKASQRMQIPENLPVEVETITPPAAEIEGLVKIGVETSDRLAYTPGRFYVRRIEVEKYAHPKVPEMGVVSAKLPPRLITGGIYDESFIAQLMVAKYDDHLPLNRQREIYQRQGVTLPISTMCEAVLTGGTALKPLWVHLQQHLLKRGELHVDETTMPCLAKEQTRKMRMWTYLSSAGEEPPIILYHFTPTKAGEHVRQFLKGWSGYLHADAASNYDELYRQNPHIREVACWAHARRKFYEIAEHAPTRVLAHEAVEQINALFAIERKAREDKLTPEEIRKRREQLAKPIVDEIKAWLEKHRPKLAPAAPTARAMNYLINHWDAFARYLDDGRLKLDNNAAERALRLAAIGRKNYLFVGNERSGEVTATLLSLIETAKANGLEPLGYLTRAMRELPLIDPESSDANARYEALLPI